MIIGTVRVEEAKVFDSHAGQHDWFEVFWVDEKLAKALTDSQDWGQDVAPGWYWWACQPVPEPHGPFARSARAYADAQLSRAQEKLK